MLRFTQDNTDIDATTKNAKKPISQETISKFISESMQKSNHSNARFVTSISSLSQTKWSIIGTSTRMKHLIVNQLSKQEFYI